MYYTQNFSNSFLLEPDNIQFIHRQKSHFNRGLRRGLFAFLVIVSLIFGVAAFLSWRIWDIHNRYEQFGVSTAGTVVDRGYSSGRSTTYYLYYSYNVPGQDGPDQGKQDVDYDFYHQTRLGAKLPIEYLSNDPTTSKIAGREADLTWYIVFGLVMAVCLLFISLIVRNIIRRNRLERTGRLLPARLASAYLQERRNRRRRYYVLEVYYDFQNPYGKVLSGKERYVRNDLYVQPLPPPGTPLVLLYASDQLYSLL
ncbi:MAG: hypothetical protein BGO39_32310 [Chloroflexi bacterium 54-19]|nr:MAG: hypothetical protein BGO39_32310 [Chloroflexi bacterium 54-19]